MEQRGRDAVLDVWVSQLHVVGAELDRWQDLDQGPAEGTVRSLAAQIEGFHPHQSGSGWC